MVLGSKSLLCVCTVTDTGPAHAREFECCVTVRGWEFTGSGSTKKAAKAAAAEKALQYLHNVHSFDVSSGGTVPNPASVIGE